MKRGGRARSKRPRSRGFKRMHSLSVSEGLSGAIRLMRTKNRLTQAEFAGAITDYLKRKVPQVYVSKVERGAIVPEESELRAISFVLGCSLSEIWRLAENLSDVLTAFCGNGPIEEFSEMIDRKDLMDHFEIVTDWVLETA